MYAVDQWGWLPDAAWQCRPMSWCSIESRMSSTRSSDACANECGRVRSMRCSRLLRTLVTYWLRRSCSSHRAAVPADVVYLIVCVLAMKVLGDRPRIKGRLADIRGLSPKTPVSTIPRSDASRVCSHPMRSTRWLSIDGGLIIAENECARFTRIYAAANKKCG
jgi:hypothetical protein